METLGRHNGRKTFKHCLHFRYKFFDEILLIQMKPLPLHTKTTALLTYS